MHFGITDCLCLVNHAWSVANLFVRLVLNTVLSVAPLSKSKANQSMCQTPGSNTANNWGQTTLFLAAQKADAQINNKSRSILIASLSPIASPFSRPQNRYALISLLMCGVYQPPQYRPPLDIPFAR